MSRKKPLLLDGERTSSFCKLVRFSTGVFVTLDHEARSELCCITKFVEGMSHESFKLPFVGVMFICGDGVVCNV